MKKCPFCAEMIKKDALICRYCKSSFKKSAENKNAKKTEKLTLNSNISIIVVFKIVLFLLLTFYLWFITIPILFYKYRKNIKNLYEKIKLKYMALNSKAQKLIVALITLVPILLYPSSGWLMLLPIYSYIYRKDLQTTSVNIVQKWKSFTKKTKKILIIIVPAFIVLASFFGTSYMKYYRSHHTVPTLYIENMSDINNTTTRDTSISIKGSVEPVWSAVHINNKNIDTEDGKFNYVVNLDNESNNFNVKALNGEKYVSSTINISIDREFYGDDLIKLNEKKEKERLANEAKKAEQEKARIAKKKKALDEYKKQLEIEMDDIIAFDNTSFRQNIDGILLEVGLFEEWISVANEAQSHYDKEIVDLGKSIERSILKLQVKEFPLMRKAYGEALSKKLWIDNIDVNVKGGGNNTIEFENVTFIDNKSIYDVHTMMKETLESLRFDQVNYKWSSSVYAEYSGIKLESKRDDAL